MTIRAQLASLALEAQDDAVLVYDAQGREVYANPAGEGTRAYLASRDLVLDVRRDFRPSPVERLLAGEVVDDPPRFFAADTAGRWLSARGRPLWDHDGRRVGFALFLRDVSELKAKEQVLQRRSAELARSNRDLEGFAAVASHDLQEPLRMVSSYLEILREELEDALTEQQAEYFEFACDGAERMQSLIEGLLDLARIDPRPVRPSRVPASRLAREVSSDLEVAIQESRAELEVDACGALCGDAGQLRQLLTNLVANALKFCHDTPRIRVTLDGSGTSNRIVVEDEGVGMVPHPRIFTPFGRQHGREFAGSGIGLALVRRIAENHGAEVDVRSAPGEGARFTVTWTSRLPVDCGPGNEDGCRPSGPSTRPSPGQGTSFS